MSPSIWFDCFYQLNYTNVEGLVLFLLPNNIEFSRCIGTFISAKF